MLWICRAGKDSRFVEMFEHTNRIYIPWDGYNVDFSKITDFTSIKDIVRKEKGTENRTSIANWASMIYAFSHKMMIGDYVLVPEFHSHTYLVGNICSEYLFSLELDIFHHSRQVQWKYKGIPRHIFPQKVQYSLGAYKTIFSTKYESEILNCLKNYIADNKGE